MDDSNLLVQCDFEVYGHVQGELNEWTLGIETNEASINSQALDSRNAVVTIA